VIWKKNQKKPEMETELEPEPEPKKVTETESQISPSKSPKNDWSFYGQWLIIGLIGSYDAFLTVKYQQYMQYVEENPVARWIMAADGWDVSRFIGIKMFGTILALGILALIHGRNSKMSRMVIFPITILQILLLCYLES